MSLLSTFHLCLNCIHLITCKVVKVLSVASLMIPIHQMSVVVCVYVHPHYHVYLSVASSNVHLHIVYVHIALCLSHFQSRINLLGIGPPHSSPGGVELVATAASLGGVCLTVRGN